jgi:cysteine desulfurase
MDYAAATPVRPEVEKVLRDFSAFGNPGTVHTEGVAAQRALDEARQKIADAIFCRAEEIIFTSGATESNNLALLGSIFAWRAKNPGKMPHIVTTNIEHPSVLEVCKHLEHKKIAEVTYLEVSSEGMIDMKKLRESLRQETVLVSVIFASNEIGVIQPIKEISKEIRHFKKHLLGNHESIYPLLHSDASQAPCYEEIDLRNLGVSMMTISSEKIYGPRGVAMLYRKSGTPLEKIMMGGSQEFGIRPGTENVGAIVGFAEALRLAVSEREVESTRIREIQNYCFDELEKDFQGKFIVNGSRENRLPNNVNITFPGFDSELLVIELDAKGISVSEKSACNTEEGGESYVIEALRKESTGSIRISFGRETKKSDINHLTKSLLEIFQKYKDIH